jgi:hypothetical protein
MMFSSPRLYLAGGVTTMRTTGSIEPYATSAGYDSASLIRSVAGRYGQY